VPGERRQQGAVRAERRRFSALPSLKSRQANAPSSTTQLKVMMLMRHRALISFFPMGVPGSQPRAISVVYERFGVFLTLG
jgi:hypothetical protein